MTPLRPLTTSAGHFLSMQDAGRKPNGEAWGPSEVWYRGDDVAAWTESTLARVKELEAELAARTAKGKKR